MKSYSAKAIANEFIRLFQNSDNGINHSKLQKFVYFAHALSLSNYDRKLINDGFYAFPFGPVNKSLYLEFKDSKNEKIQRFLDLDQYRKEIQKDRDIFNIIVEIYEAFLNEDGAELSNLIHYRGTPWELYFIEDKLNYIDDGAIQHFYKKLLRV